MIVALLVLILLVLLLGAALVRGLIVGALGIILGGVLVLTIAGVLIGYLGDDGLIWLVGGIGVLALVLWPVLSARDAALKRQVEEAQSRSKELANNSAAIQARLREAQNKLTEAGRWRERL